ncbi:MAG: pilus assembly protein TadG-related protein [Actinomycetota bacterium]
MTLRKRAGGADAPPALPGLSHHHAGPTQWPAAGGAESGNVTLVMLAGVGIVMVLLLGLGDLSAYLLARTTAQTAADSAALAAVAELIPEIGGDPEGKAKQYARLNGAQLVSCSCSMGSNAAEVVVAVPLKMSLERLSGIKQVRAASKAEIHLPSGSS